MTATLVIHTRDIERHPGAVYIGREHAGRGRGPSFKRSRWAKPFTWHEHGREAAVDLYTRWINGDPDAAARAAATISRLGGVIQSMWVALMDDDDDADDDPDTVP